MIELLKCISKNKKQLSNLLLIQQNKEKAYWGFICCV